MTDERACASCGHTKRLADDGRCADKAACARRATATMVTTPYVGGFDPKAAYEAAQKGAE